MIQFIWIVGMLFTFGVALGEEKEGAFNQLTWSATISVLLIIMALWPILLGLIVGNYMNESTKSSNVKE